MKFNQWTLGLAAVGVISLASAARADESASPINTMVAGTMIDGYVDTSMQWNPGTGTDVAYYKFGPGKADGFNLNVVQLSISKPLDESEWASGYKVDLWFGPDAGTLNTTSSDAFAIRQAYVALRAPVGNGLDFKVGVFDSVIGYESVEAGNNPNFTRSYGHSIEPQTHTGVLATYRFCDWFSASAGVANTVGPMINQRAFPPYDNRAESYKTYMGSVALTAPQSWGWAAGSTLYAGFVNGYNSSLPYIPMVVNAGFLAPGSTVSANQTSVYVGGTLATPVTGLKLGAAWDLLDVHSETASVFNGAQLDAWAGSVYASYQATEKLSLHARGELFQLNADLGSGADNTQIWALTGTVQYDLWKNVISRAEVRWDHSDEGQYFRATHNGVYHADDRVNSILIAANIIYKF